jgi:CRP-like cAMP-binding protein
MQEILSTQAQQLIRNNPLFSNLTEDQLGELLDMMYEEKVSVGVNIVQEGEPGDTLYIIRSGRAEVLKEDDHGDFHHIAMLKTGDVIGEISLIDDRPRSATVRAVENTQLIALPVADLKAKSKPEVSIENILKVNFAKTMSQNIRKLNTRTVNKLRDQLKYTQKQIQMGHYVFRLMTLVVLYVLALDVFHAMIKLGPATAYLTIPVILLFGLGFFQLVYKSDFDLKTFGLTLQGGGESVKDSLLLSVGLMMPVIVLYKMFVVSMDPLSANAPIFFYPGIMSVLDAKEKALLVFAFAIYVPVYEFVVRGVCQTSFMMFLTHKNRRWQAILLASLFFSVTSVDISLRFAACFFMLNLFWGWLYTRHSSLLGVILSHWLLGYFALFMVGFNF